MSKALHVCIFTFLPVPRNNVLPVPVIPCAAYLIVPKRAIGAVGTAVAQKVDAIYIGAAVHGCINDDDGCSVGGCSVFVGGCFVCAEHDDAIHPPRKATHVLLVGMIYRQDSVVVEHSIGQQEPCCTALQRKHTSMQTRWPTLQKVPHKESKQISNLVYPCLCCLLTCSTGLYWLQWMQQQSHAQNIEFSQRVIHLQCIEGIEELQLVIYTQFFIHKCKQILHSRPSTFFLHPTTALHNNRSIVLHCCVGNTYR